jgi:hypothetical protein
MTQTNPQELQKQLTELMTKTENHFKQAYGDLHGATNRISDQLAYQTRTHDVAAIQNQVGDTQQYSENHLADENQTLGRRHEMEEWTVGNKRDTLFVFSFLFVIVSVMLLFTGLLRMYLISSSLWTVTAVLLFLVFILLFLNRYQYTEVNRNKFYWNKRLFDGKYGKIPAPLCPEAVEEIV